MLRTGLDLVILVVQPLNLHHMYSLLFFRTSVPGYVGIYSSRLDRVLRLYFTRFGPLCPVPVVYPYNLLMCVILTGFFNFCHIFGFSKLCHFLRSPSCLGNLGQPNPVVYCF